MSFFLVKPAEAQTVPAARMAASAVISETTPSAAAVKLFINDVLKPNL
ncbi:hypothetical protein FPSE_06717 [Fusarium pseudograminearum CS3096]|uniref:Uncharacterized protein n=1 Tax=Fusarium pseudograminearum (strain CS3096) TaxID=1028729 RepID=K3VG90_FUSPC|nr:hypothetical protein FPSE_06717 [Fusarium pseudograminearum CS3096]EKJ73104.1 hypothetical protein FPSE_06717 [Fusarium pseudograminearum CS3096]